MSQLFIFPSAPLHLVWQPYVLYMRPAVAPSWLSHPCAFLCLSRAGLGCSPGSAEAAGLLGQRLCLAARQGRPVQVTLPVNSPKRLDHLVFLLSFRSARYQEFMQCTILEQRPPQPFPSTQVIPTALLKNYENEQCEGILSHWNKNITLVE